MILTERERDKLNKLAQSNKGTYLLPYLEKVKGHVSDIRNPINVKPEIENEVRLAVCELLDELIINKFKVLNGEVETQEERFD